MISKIIPTGTVYRLGRKPDPWAPPDWAFAGDDGTFGNRFDDPRGRYRVLYASSSRLGCFLETLARFRLDLGLQFELAEIDGPEDHVPLGVVPIEWKSDRTMGAADAREVFAEIGSSESLSTLRNALAPTLVKLGMDDLDAAVIRSSVQRPLTQAVSRHVYDSHEKFDGICYRSRYGDDVQNWAIFEPFNSVHALTPNQAVDLHDADFQAALTIHYLRIEEAAAAG